MAQPRLQQFGPLPDQYTPRAVGVQPSSPERRSSLWCSDDGRTILEPTPEIVESLEDCFKFGIHSPSDKRFKVAGLPLDNLECSFSRRPHMFVPPGRLELTTDASAFWSQKAEMILREAQDRVFDTVSTRDPNILDLGSNYTVADHQSVLFWDVQACNGRPSQEIIDSIKTLIGATKEKLKSAITSILSDANLMARINQTCEVYRQAVIQIIFAETIKHIDRLRQRVERPEDKQRLLSLLNQVVQNVLRMDDIEVRLLNTRNAVVEGCMGLYAPDSKPGQKSVIEVPLSIYGTNQLCEFDDILRTLAHELAHHEISRTARVMREDDVDPDIYWRYRNHNLKHSVIAHRFLQILRATNFLCGGAADGPTVSFDPLAVQRTAERADALFAGGPPSSGRPGPGGGRAR